MQEFLTLLKELGPSTAFLIFAIIYLAKKNDSIDKKIVELLMDQSEFLKEIKSFIENGKKLDSQEYKFQMENLISKIENLENKILDKLETIKNDKYTQ